MQATRNRPPGQYSYKGVPAHFSGQAWSESSIVDYLDEQGIPFWLEGTKFVVDQKLSIRQEVIWSLKLRQAALVVYCEAWTHKCVSCGGLIREDKDVRCLLKGVKHSDRIRVLDLSTMQTGDWHRHCYLRRVRMPGNFSRRRSDGDIHDAPLYELGNDLCVYCQKEVGVYPEYMDRPTVCATCWPNLPGGQGCQ